MKWISVDDDQPHPSDKEIILVVDDVSLIISLARFIEDDYYFEVMNMHEVEVDYCVTHWMPLPLPPKE